MGICRETGFIVSDLYEQGAGLGLHLPDRAHGITGLIRRGCTSSGFEKEFI